MTTRLPETPEGGLDEILEYCNDLRQAPVPGDDALPTGFTGTIGHFPVYFPEEIAHSAGLRPGGILRGGNKLELKHADAHMGSFVCSICRSTTEMGLNGALGSLSGFVTHPICDAAKHLAGIWSRNFPEQLAQILYLPPNVNTPGAVRYVAAEYQRLRAEMEKKAGRSSDDDSLRASIRAYNRNRRLLRALTRISCEEHNTLLEHALAGIRARHRPPLDKPRVVFVGGFCEQPPLEMLRSEEHTSELQSPKDLVCRLLLEKK